MSDVQILKVTVSLSTGEYEATFRMPTDVVRKNQFAVLNLARAMLDEAIAVIKAKPSAQDQMADEEPVTEVAKP